MKVQERMCFLRQTLIVCIAFISMQASADTEMVDAGATLFSTYCESCHGSTGDGNGPVAEGLILKPRDFAMAAFKFDTDADWQRGTDIDLQNVISEGAAVYGGSAVMPAWGHLSDQEVKSLVAYIRSLEGSR
jgi:mono/diheme cytochrome c family protein